MGEKKNQKDWEKSKEKKNVLKLTNDGGEDGAGGVVTGKAGFAHAGAIIDHKGSNFVVTHLFFGEEKRKKEKGKKGKKRQGEMIFTG